eukprot:gene22930-29108_t
MEWIREFLTENRAYKKAITEQANKKIMLDIKKAGLKKDVILEQVIGSLQLGLTRIATKIKTAVKDYPLIVDRLKTKIKLSSTGQWIHDPYTSNNVSGMYEMLFVDYAKASLVVFARMLLDWIDHEVSLSECNSNPMKVVNDCDQTLRAFAQLDMWRYMSKDRMAVVFMLKSMDKDSALRKEAVREIYAFIRRVENSPGGEDAYNEAADTDMPMYHFLCEWIRTEHDPVQKFDLSGAKTVKSGKNDKPNAVVKPFNLNQTRRRDGETAAAAGAEQGDGSSVSGGGDAFQTTRSSGLRGVDSMAKAVGPYTREITRSDWLYCESGGKKHLYTATSQKCPNCNGDKKHPNPVCFLAECNKCGLFGHKILDCKQNTKSGFSAEVDTEENEEVEEGYESDSA